MSNVPDNLVYTKEHEYVATTDDPGVVRIGITDYAQGELGDVVFVNLPKPGDKVDGHQSFGTIEAVKAVSELYAPLAGEVVDGERRARGRSRGGEPRSLRRRLDDHAPGEEPDGPRRTCSRPRRTGPTSGSDPSRGESRT